LPGIVLDSNQDSAGEKLDERHRGAARSIIRKLEGGEPQRTGNHAKERFPEGGAPGAHGPDVTGARPRRAALMSVQETHYVASHLLAS
jgi:hypothetical protein